MHDNYQEMTERDMDRTLYEIVNTPMLSLAGEKVTRKALKLILRQYKLARDTDERERYTAVPLLRRNASSFQE